jgi:hypothetical protein
MNAGGLNRKNSQVSGGPIGQLTENWGDELFAVLKNARGKAYCNYTVCFSNKREERKNGNPKPHMKLRQNGTVS